ncbi:hypothetical protein B0H14DRAFT_2569644 [Mycena olivaceomarginata]|nr:hypothetical protein B0H14DRAFT_2569644 [Mycena olivaceomarginata]
MSFEVVVPAPSYAPQLSGTFLLRGSSSRKPKATYRRHSSPYARLQRQIPASNSRYFEIDNLYPTRQTQTAPENFHFSDSLDAFDHYFVNTSLWAAIHCCFTRKPTSPPNLMASGKMACARHFAAQAILGKKSNGMNIVIGALSPDANESAVSTRAALTYWYRTIRPNESVTEWRIDSKTGEWLTTSFGLPTRSRHVSELMTGLEKTKAKAGEVSVSASALSLSDMHNLYDLCFRPNCDTSRNEMGHCALQVVRIQFESINIIPGSRMSSLFIHLLECLLLPFQGESFEVKMFTRKSEGASHFQRVTALLLVDAAGSRWEVKVW